jgi:hypothetical protein
MSAFIEAKDKCNLSLRRLVALADLLEQSSGKTSGVQRETIGTAAAMMRDDLEEVRDAVAAIVASVKP